MRKRNAPKDVPTNGNRWFLTYSDMITLLLALFIMLYSISNVNAEKYQKLVEGFHTAFGTGIGTGSGTGSGTGNAYYYIPGITTTSSTSSSTGIGGFGTAENNALTEIYVVLQNYIKANGLEDEIEVKDTGELVQIHLKDVVLFKPNSATMLESSKPIIQEIGSALTKVYDRVDHITISGHTADIVVDPENSDKLSWELSTQRAVTVLNELVDNGLDQRKLSIQGYAHFDPIATNSTEEGRSKNRRVEISIYKNAVLGVGATGRDKATLASESSASSASSENSSQSSSTSATAAKH
jgi:chemotaxis protein MotB